MRRFFIGNFDFEHQLASEAYGASVGSVSSLNASLASCWLGLATDGDQIYLPGNVSADFAELLTASGLPQVRFTSQWPDEETAGQLEFVPWGWSAAMAELAQSKGFAGRIPDLAAVRRVNSRQFSFPLEREWGQELPGSCEITSLESLEEALQNLCVQSEIEWVLKADFSMSARERMRGQGGTLSAQIRGWAAKRLAQGQPAFLEPWVNRLSEAGIQWEIPETDEPTLVGLAVLLSDERGQYRGSRIKVDRAIQNEWQPAIEVTRRVAQEVQQTGYTGPLGIDAMQFRDREGTVRFRSIQDVNGRYTMGRLALGFARFLSEEQAASWLHFPWKESYGIRFSNWLRCVAQPEMSGSRLVATSPDQIDGQVVRLSHALLIANSAAELEACEEILMRAHAELNVTAG